MLVSYLCPNLFMFVCGGGFLGGEVINKYFVLNLKP